MLITISRHTVCRKMRNAPLTLLKFGTPDNSRPKTVACVPFGITASHLYHSQLNRKPKPSNTAWHQKPPENLGQTPQRFGHRSGKFSTRGLNPTFQREQSLMLLQRVSICHSRNVIAHNPGRHCRVHPVTFIEPFGRQCLWLN